MTERRVRTPAGVQHFNQPMGSIIRRDAPPVTLRSTMPGRRPPRRVPMPSLSPRPPKTIQGPLRQISDALATIPAADQPQVAADIAHATAHQTLAEIARDLPILSQDEAKEVQDRLNLWIDKHPSLRKVRDWMDHIVNEYLGTGTAWGNITTTFGLPNATSDPVGFITQFSAMILHWLQPVGRTLGLSAAAVRRVRTPEGARKYGQPIGSVIVRDAMPLVPWLPKPKAVIPKAPSRQRVLRDVAAKDLQPGDLITSTREPGSGTVLVGDAAPGGMAQNPFLFVKAVYLDGPNAGMLRTLQLKPDEHVTLHEGQVAPTREEMTDTLRRELAEVQRKYPNGLAHAITEATQPGQNKPPEPQMSDELKAGLNQTEYVAWMYKRDELLGKIAEQVSLDPYTEEVRQLRKEADALDIKNQSPEIQKTERLLTEFREQYAAWSEKVSAEAGKQVDPRSPAAQGILEDVQRIGAQARLIVNAELVRRTTVMDGDIGDAARAVRLEVSRDLISQLVGNARRDQITQTWPSGYDNSSLSERLRALKPAEQKAMTEALLHYPKSWVLNFDSGKPYTTYFSTRGYHRAEARHIAISDPDPTVGLNGDGSGERAVMTHELGHAMEAAIPGLKDLEQVFWHSRVEGGDLKMLPQDGGFYADDAAVKRKTAMRYSMKTYGNVYSKGNPWELFTTGIQNVLGDGEINYTVRRGKSDDSSLWDFTMGAMLMLDTTPVSVPDPAAMVAAGPHESWRWQLRDKNGNWIEMGSEVKWLWQGLEREGLVIGSSSPGIATVREHLTELIHQVPSSRLEVTKSAAEVVARIYESAEGRDAPDWERLGLVKFPALAEFAKRAKEQAIPITKWSSTGQLLPDELAPKPDMMSVEERQTITARLIDYGLTDVQAERFVAAYLKAAYEAVEQGYHFKNAGASHKLTLERQRELRATGNVVIAISPFSAARFIEEGRYKTQFEINQSGGMFAPDMRADDELLHQGLLEDIPAAKRPVYGFVAKPGDEDQDEVDQYGSVRMVLKPEVRDRTTMTIGDSLNGKARPVPLTGDITDEQFAAAKSMAPGDYTEAQIHGGVTLDDVEKIIITEQADYAFDVYDVKNLREIAERIGVTVEDQRKSQKPPSKERPLFDPTPTLTPEREAIYRAEIQRNIDQANAVILPPGRSPEIPVYRVLADDDNLNLLYPDALVYLSESFAQDAARDNPGNKVVRSLVPLDKLGQGRKGWEEYTSRYQDYIYRDLKPLVAAVIAGGESWRWQLRDKNGQWIEMGAEVKWMAKGRWLRGKVTGSPSPGIASIREAESGRQATVPARSLTVVPTDTETAGIRNIQRVAKAHGGASIKVTGEEPTAGYMAAQLDGGIVIPQDEFFGEAGVVKMREFLRANAAAFKADPTLYLGIWHDKEHGVVTVDISHNIMDEADAVQYGKDQNQVSVWDVVNKKEIDTGGTGGYVASAGERASVRPAPGRHRQHDG